MYQDKNYVNEKEVYNSDYYTNEVTFNLYQFQIFGEKIYFHIKENIKNGILDKLSYNIWKEFIDNLNERKDYKESENNFIVSYYHYEKMHFVKDILDFHEKHDPFNLHLTLEKLNIIYKKALRDSNINFILED